MSARPQLAPVSLPANQNTATELPSGNRRETAESVSQAAIAQLAYVLWQQRGCPIGSAEIDWREAEQQLSR